MKNYEKLLKTIKRDTELSEMCSYMHTYHKNISSKEYNVERCVVCVILKKEPIIQVETKSN